MSNLLKLILLIFYFNIGGIFSAISKFHRITYDDLPEDLLRPQLGPFIKIGKGYYFVEVTKTLNFFEAVEFCKRSGGELVSFESETELDDMSKYLVNNGFADKWIWTSANDLGREGKFKFMGTGEPMNYARWSPDQPYSAYGNEDCVHLQPQSGTFYMNDLRCRAPNHFICEMSGTISKFHRNSYDDLPEDLLRPQLGPFVKIGKGYYFVEVTKTLNFFEAVEFCKGIGGELVSFESEAELDDMSKYLVDNRSKHKYIWTSANDLGREGKFKFMGTGEPMNYARWFRGQPESVFGNEDCVHLQPESGIFYMNDLRCNVSLHFICEMRKQKLVSLTAW